MSNAAKRQILAPAQIHKIQRPRRGAATAVFFSGRRGKKVNCLTGARAAGLSHRPRHLCPMPLRRGRCPHRPCRTSSKTKSFPTALPWGNSMHFTCHASPVRNARLARHPFRQPNRRFGASVILPTQAGVRGLRPSPRLRSSPSALLTTAQTLLSTCPYRDHRQAWQGREARACRPREPRWSAGFRPRKRHSPEQNGSP